MISEVNEIVSNSPAGIFVDATYGYGSHFNYLKQNNGHLEYSKNSRMTTYLLTLELIKQNPIFGVGYGGFLGSFRKYYAERKQIGRASCRERV